MVTDKCLIQDKKRTSPYTKKERAVEGPLLMSMNRDQFVGNELRSTPPPTVPAVFVYVRVVPVCTSVTETV